MLEPVTRKLQDAGGLSSSQLQEFCEVEFGLYLHRKLMPTAPAIAAWALFSGYPFASARGLVPDADTTRMLRSARYVLWTLRRRNTWAEALANYQSMDPLLRWYDVPTVDDAPKFGHSVIAMDREQHYERLLRQGPPLTGSPLDTATSGLHRFAVGRSTATVRIPETKTLPRPQCYALGTPARNRGKPVEVDWDALVRTAKDMDKVKFANWECRLLRIDLSVASEAGFTRDTRFTVNHIQHLLGIVNAGKSTLRDVLTVHLAARENLRVTVVITDVAETLKSVHRYNTYVPALRKQYRTSGVEPLPIAAAPILGASGKQRHAQRLHRRLAGRGERNLLAHNEPGFAYLSTSCALNALRADTEDVLAFNEAPCTRLAPRRPPRPTEDGSSPWRRKLVGCPYWGACPRHNSSRLLVDADIWVGTPAALVDSAVPWQQSAERVRYIELACRRSDLVIVDEADYVQMNLDRMFAPAVPLVGGGEGRSLLDEVTEHKGRELSEGARRQLSDRDVEDWSAAVNTVVSATDRLYAKLVRDPKLRDWVKIGYFSAWTLQLRLVEERYPDPDAPTEELRARDALTGELDRFRDNPFGDRGRPVVRRLTGVVNEVLNTGYQSATRRKVKEALIDLFDLEPVLRKKRKERAEALSGPSAKKAKKPKKPLPTPEEWLDDMVRRFEFTLVLSALEPKLALMNAMWPRVESVLKLGFNEMYQRPPDYGPIVPEAPMGNVLGFQFIVDGPAEGNVQSGELRYFRCSGVGRELLRSLSDLPEVDGLPGTNVLLMSGSSWAGKSSRYHIQVPVGVIIEPKNREIRRIADESTMRFEFVLGPKGAVQVSGADLEDRPEVLRRIAQWLGDLDGDRPSPLQRELLELAEPRRRILLLVGSYLEAALVADTLHNLRDRWKGRVLRLVSDDDEVEFATSLIEDGQHAGVLRRGDVESLHETDAEILVAPLLAVERGHNILNEEGTAAIGSVYFLARPNPRPDDLGLAVHTVNDWITRAVSSGEFGKWVRDAASLDEGAGDVRTRARSEWYRALARSLAWSRLGDDREAVTWDLLVLIWQVIGRLVRGGVPARVVFVDAAFAPNTAARTDDAEDQIGDSPETSLLHSIVQVLRPYFGGAAEVTAHDRKIVTALYLPLWKSLTACLDLDDEGA
ncbi:hypothetical protein [Actinosynnema sp. NPDC020468]|uniref:pPIWI_RE_Z domain-containing protein n=1 Tax=Actinosynnema sp. NPDC020468 TaxID=3154488 RepID=UPI0033D3FCAC